MRRDIYSGRLEHNGEDNERTMTAANNYAAALISLQRFEEAKALLRKTIPVARRVLGENHEYTLKARLIRARTLYRDDRATLADLREAVTTLEDVDRIARRVLGGAHPTTAAIEESLGKSRAALCARETPEALAQDAFRTARAKLAQERAELAKTLADASARPSPATP